MQVGDLIRYKGKSLGITGILVNIRYPESVSPILVIYWSDNSTVEYEREDDRWLEVINV